MRHEKICTLLLTLICGVTIAAQVNAAPLYGARTAGPGAESTFYTIDPTTGVATLVGTIGYTGVSGIDMDPATEILYGVGKRIIDEVQVLITIDPVTGAGAEVGPTGLEGLLGFVQISDISFRNSDGVLYAYVEPGYDGIATIDITTGAATLVGQSLGSAGSAMGFDAADNLYFINIGTDIYTLDQTNGDETFVTSTSGANGRHNSLDFHPLTLVYPARSNVLYALDNAGSQGGGPNYLVTVNPTTGVVTTIGQTTNGMDALAWGPLTADERLPVELASFNLSSRNRNVMLSWQTASEIDNAGFEVQRAGTDSSFKTITSYLNNPSLVGLGTSSHGKSYRYTDGSDGGLVAGKTYLYRLVDVSREGVRNAHSAVSVRIEAADVVADQGALRLYPVSPNPVQDFAQISFSMRDAGSVRVEVYTVDGRLVATPIAGSYGVGDHAETLSLQGLSAGSYTLVLTANHSVRTQRLVVVR